MRPLPFGVFLALALFACFPQVLLGLESFFTRDYGVLAYPNIAFQHDCFWRGELPVWNPYSNCGQPFLAQWGTMTLYPGALIYLLLPLPWSLSLFCFAHLWLAGFGMYRLAKHWTNSNFAGAVAGTAFVFNGITFASFVWPNYLVTLGWMPFVLLLAERAWREGGRWIIGTSLIATLQMLSGAPEVIVFTWLIIGSLWVCDAMRAPVSSLPFFRRMIAVVLLTSGLMAIQLLPFFELLHVSHRDVGFGTGRWQLPLWGWGNFLVPLYNSFETTSGQYYQYSQGFLSSVYIGGFAVALALVAVLRWPDPRIRVLTALAVLSVFFAFGDQTAVFKIARKALPFLGVARFPVKFLFLVNFVIPLLAGCGVAAVLRGQRTGPITFAGVVVIAAIVLIAWAGYGERFMDYSGWPENFRGNMHFTWHTPAAGRWVTDGISNTVARIAFLIFSLTCASLALRPRARSTGLAFFALALVVADARLHTPEQNPTLPARLFTEHFWAGEEKPEPGKARALITPDAEEFLTFVSSTNAQRVWELKRRAEWSNLNLLDRIPKVNGSATLQTREQRLVEQTLYTMTNRLPAGLLDFLGVTWLTGPGGTSWTPRSNSMPLLSAGQQPLFLEQTQALATLTNSAFEPRSYVVLPPASRSVIPQTNRSSVQLSNIIVRASLLKADVRATEPTLVIVAQSSYPAWRATVDGATAPLLQANLAFQAVPVSAGNHQLQLLYSDQWLKIGAGISAVSLAIGIAAAFLLGKSRNRHSV
jgi:hypothetical protein